MLNNSSSYTILRLASIDPFYRINKGMVNNRKAYAVLCLASLHRCSSLCSHQSSIKISAKKNHLRLKSEGRFRRIEYLSNKIHSLEEHEEFELTGLLKKGDPFDASNFSPEHQDFKAQHKAAFLSIALQIVDKDSTARCPMFYLDGKDGASTTALLASGFDRKDLFVANEFEESFQELREAPLSLTNCALGRAEEVLLNLQDTPFVAAYLDGCGGSPRPIIEMIRCLFLGQLAKSIAIGFTLTSADASGRELIDRIQDVTRATLYAARERDYAMYHVGDDPVRFGVDPELPRKHDGTATCWLVCTRKSMP